MDLLTRSTGKATNRNHRTVAAMLSIVEAICAVIFCAAVLILALVATGHADETIYRCVGILTSNNVCIGSESNVDSVDNHRPIYGETWRVQR
jgi:hypothetical protein